MAEQQEAQHLAAAVHELTEALRLTVEYVGTDTLPPIEGWSWYDALVKHDPETAHRFLRQWVEQSSRRAAVDRQAAALRPSGNVLTTRQEHARYCYQPSFGSATDWGRPGDVRRCEHGYVQIGFEVQGTIPCYWRDLSPVFTPILWRRARKALT